jgi:hypothetical protein
LFVIPGEVSIRERDPEPSGRVVEDAKIQSDRSIALGSGSAFGLRRRLAGMTVKRCGESA